MKTNKEFTNKVNGILENLPTTSKQKFFEEVRVGLSKGQYHELAISEAFKKLGIENMMRIDVNQGIDTLYLNLRKIEDMKSPKLF